MNEVSSLLSLLLFLLLSMFIDLLLPHLDLFCDLVRAAIFVGPKVMISSNLINVDVVNVVVVVVFTTKGYQTFKEFDTDGDGHLDLKEIGDVVMKLGEFFINYSLIDSLVH